MAEIKDTTRADRKALDPDTQQEMPLQSAGELRPEEMQRSDSSQWRLIWRQFKKHKLGYVSLYVLIALLVIGVFFPGFFAPYNPQKRFDYQHLPPQSLRWVDAEGRFHLWPFTYNYEQVRDRQSFQMVTRPDTSQRYPLRFFVSGDEYRLLGVIPTSLHFFGVADGGTIILFGTDELGRDMFSRTIYALRISMVVGLVGVAISLFLGMLLGGISGLLGGWVDGIIQRVIEVFIAIPKIPLWMALAAAVPREWGPVQVYFAITIILSFMGWTGMARVVRSKFLSLRKEEYVLAATGFNVPQRQIIFRHLVPNFISYVLVNLTLSIPGMIIGETSLSFLGIGLRPPVISLGVLLQQAQSFQNVALHPWLLIPGIFVILIVLIYNFVGDGLRDAADPYKKYQ